jgi:elongator complex protein 3
LFSLLRLRIPNNNNADHIISALKNSALIREVHTYGKLASIDKKDVNSPQHIGLGKKLLFEAERIARVEFSLQKIAVISGVGVRNYYRKNGYKLKDTYLVKKL